MDEPDAQHAHHLADQECVVLARDFGRQIHLGQPRRGISRGVRHQFHDQCVVEVAVGPGHAHAGFDQLVERVHLGVLPGRLRFLAAEARALGHGAHLPAAAHLAALLVLSALLETALAHVAIHLGAADLRASSHGVDGGFLAGLERTENFVDDAVVDQRLQAGRSFHAGGMLLDNPRARRSAYPAPMSTPLVHPSDIAFTEAVKAQQTRMGSRRAYSHMEDSSGWPTSLTPELERFIAARDSMYLATANAAGQPYIQHR